MICIVVYCDHTDCHTEQSCSIEVLAGNKKDGETFLLTAARQCTEFGWQISTEFGHGLFDGECTVFCPDHNT